MLRLWNEFRHAVLVAWPGRYPAVGVHLPCWQELCAGRPLCQLHEISGSRNGCVQQWVQILPHPAPGEGRNRNVAGQHPPFGHVVMGVTRRTTFAGTGVWRYWPTLSGSLTVTSYILNCCSDVTVVNWRVDERGSFSTMHKPTLPIRCPVTSRQSVGITVIVSVAVTGTNPKFRNVALAGGSCGLPR